LWSEQAQQGLIPFGRPEILEADLAPMVLELAQWGVTDVRTLRWLDVPPQAAVAQALGLLQQLGALDEAGRITSHGTAMLELGIHPRLAHMVCRGRALGCGALACDIAALLGERDILRGRREGSDVDIATRLQVLHGALSERGDMGGLRRVREAAVQLRRQAGIREGEARPRDDAMLGVLLAFAYPDRIAQARAGAHGRFRLSNGQGAWVAESDRLAANQYLVAAQLDGERTEARVFLAAALSRDDLLEHFREQLVTREEIAWGRREQAVIARRVVCLGQLVLREEPLTQAAAERIAAALLEGLREGGLAVLPWDKESRALWARLRFVATLPASTLASGDARWPDVSETALLATLESWLAPYLGGMTRLAQLSRLAMSAILRGLLTWQQQQRLDELAPSHVEVPSGSRIAIDYESEDGPILAVRLQELFGLAQTPRIAAGHVALKLHLLSPAYRPVQVTRDLASFWSNTYQDVKKDLKGRYPKHYWPDDPLQAQPTRGVRRR
jgi:ATP-dependent helicase HrpB